MHQIHEHREIPIRFGIDDTFRIASAKHDAQSRTSHDRHAEQQIPAQDKTQTPTRSLPTDSKPADWNQTSPWPPPHPKQRSLRPLPSEGRSRDKIKHLTTRCAQNPNGSPVLAPNSPLLLRREAQRTRFPPLFLPSPISLCLAVLAP